MFYSTSALVTILLPALALARPNAHDQHEKFHKRHDHAGTGTGTAVQHHQAHPTHGPYHVGNDTSGAAAHTGKPDVVTIQSIITVVPLPVSTDQAKAAHKQAQIQAANGSPIFTCPAPDTITVTAEPKTVTVTVAPASSSSVAPVRHQVEVPVSAAPVTTSSTAAPVVHTTTVAPAVQTPAAPIVQQKAKVQDFVQSAVQSAVVQPVSAPKSGDAVKARGISYTNLDMANSLTQLGWACNWDSSPLPAVGHAQGKFSGGEFVPTLLGPAEVHTVIWDANSKGYEWAMGFNEPNKSPGEGGCGPMDASSAASQMDSLMAKNLANGQKLTTACVSNDVPEYLDQFLSSSTLKYEALCFHWYGETLEGFKDSLNKFSAVQQKFGIAELWLSEFGFNVDIGVDASNEFLAFLDASHVNRYAYNAEKMYDSVKSAYAS